jgi:hypothetical protein
LKRNLATFAWACAAFIAVFVALVVLTYAVWSLQSWEYNHSPPRSPGDPHDASAYVLLGMEMFFGLPGGLVLGGIAAGMVISKRRRRPALQGTDTMCVKEIQ